MNLHKLSDDELHTSTVSAAKREREETINLLKHLAEVERRKLFSKFKCDSLHAYCVDYLKMSDPQAGRRVSASRLLNELPVIEEKVRSGAMTLTSICQANTFFRKEALAGNKLVREEKLELISELENKASRKVEQILLSKSEQPEIHMRETVKQKTVNLTEIKLLVDEETLAKLNRLKEIYSHEMPNATYAQIVSKLAAIGIEKLDPDLKAQRAVSRKTEKANPDLKSQFALSRKTKKADPDLEVQLALNRKFSKPALEKTTPRLKGNFPSDRGLVSSGLSVNTSAASTPAPERAAKTFFSSENKTLSAKRSRYIPAPIRHAVWVRDRGCCSFKDFRTGEICGSRKFIEYDHITPFALGGEHKPENLRLRCRAHNQRHAIDTFGLAKVSQYLASPQREIN